MVKKNIKANYMLMQEFTLKNELNKIYHNQVKFILRMLRVTQHQKQYHLNLKHLWGREEEIIFILIILQSIL